VRVAPRMVVDPAPRERALRPAPRYEEAARPRPPQPGAPKAAARVAADEPRAEARVLHKTPRPAYGRLPVAAAHGYRAEFGYRITSGYVIAPDARIITIETDD
jgi:hypothetical protein